MVLDHFSAEESRSSVLRNLPTENFYPSWIVQAPKLLIAEMDRVHRTEFK